MEVDTVVISLQMYVQHSDLALSQAIAEVPAAEIGVVSEAGTDPDHETYFFWVETDDYEAVERAFEADPTVASHRCVIEAEDQRTYGIEYADNASLLSPVITEIGGLILEARSHGTGWLLTVHLQSHDMLDTLDEYLTSEGFRYEVFELRHVDEIQDRADFGLTAEQIEALVCAYVHGYYDEPRQISLEELGSILGISETAVSGRLRRGSARLAEVVLEA
ncbi:MAG: helix-turn-helix domain-containing protein [Salinirussus sp.]